MAHSNSTLVTLLLLASALLAQSAMAVEPGDEDYDYSPEPEASSIYAASGTLMVFSARGATDMLATPISHVDRLGSTLTVWDKKGNSVRIDYFSASGAASDQESMRLGSSINVSECVRAKAGAEAISTEQVERGSQTVTIQTLPASVACGLSNSVPLVEFPSRSPEYTSIDLSKGQLVYQRAVGSTSRSSGNGRTERAIEGSGRRF